MIKLSAVTHWGIPVNDLDAAEQFYTEIMGFRAIGRLSNGHMSCMEVLGQEIVLFQRKEPLLLGDLQKKILVTSGGVTYLVNRLVAKGLVTRESFPGDKRSRFAVLTPEGSALIKKIFPGHAKRIVKAMSALSPKEQKRLTAMLRTLGSGA